MGAEKGVPGRPRSFTLGFTIRGKGYVAMGYATNCATADCPPSELNDFYEYDPATDKWAKRADFAGAERRFAAGYSLDGKGHIACGEGWVETSPTTKAIVSLNDVWEYAPSTDAWGRIADYPGAKPFGAVGTADGGKAIVGTGKNYPFYQSLKDFWIY